MQRQFVGLLDGSGDVWGVTIPDVPGVHGGGATPEAAIADAMSAFREVAAMMASDGEPIPEPRTLSELRQDAEINEALSGTAAAVMIPLVLEKGRPVKANLSLDAGLLEAIDAEAGRRGLTRSAFIVAAAMDKIGFAPVAPEKISGAPVSREKIDFASVTRDKIDVPMLMDKIAAEIQASLGLVKQSTHAIEKEGRRSSSAKNETRPRRAARKATTGRYT